MQKTHWEDVSKCSASSKASQLQSAFPWWISAVNTSKRKQTRWQRKWLYQLQS